MLGKLSIAAFAVAVVFSVIQPVPGAMAQSGSDVEAIHDELRAVKDRLANAANAQDFDALTEIVAPDGIITTMTNDVLRGPDELKSYMERMFTGDSRLIDSMTVASAEADELSRLYGNNSVAVATGYVETRFKLAVGREFDWPIRWTAVLMKQGDRWLITQAHFSGNAIDNPVVAATSGLLAWLPWVTALLGLTVGFVVAWFLRRKSKS